VELVQYVFFGRQSCFLVLCWDKK